MKTIIISVISIGALFYAPYYVAEIYPPQHVSVPGPSLILPPALISIETPEPDKAPGCNWDRDIEQKFFADLLKLHEKDIAARFEHYKKERAEKRADREKRQEQHDEYLKKQQEQRDKEHEEYLDKLTLPHPYFQARPT